MNEIYWITRVDAVKSMLWAFVAISGCCLIIYYMFHDEDTDIPKMTKSVIKRIFCFFLCVVFMQVFIPSKNDMLLIYGLGGTIDYIKGNEKAKQLPDKCIDALEQYVESINKADEITDKDNDKK